MRDHLFVAVSNSGFEQPTQIIGLFTTEQAAKTGAVAWADEVSFRSYDDLYVKEMAGTETVTVWCHSDRWSGRKVFEGWTDDPDA